jgi:nitrogenase molybdenum-iron protein beta chain
MNQLRLNGRLSIRDINALPEIPIEGINYEQIYIEKEPICPQYIPPDETIVPSSKRSVTIDPGRICMPFGALWASVGVHNCIPFVQGAQGCTTYPRYTFARVFREPVSIATASFHEDAAVFGGRDNLVEGIRNLICRYQPDVIAIITVCSSEIIGDDMQSYLDEAKEELEDEFGEEILDRVKFVIINTPSFAGSHVEGYNRAAKAFLQAFARKSDGQNNKVNIIPGMVTPGDIRELKHILRLMDIEAITLFDISGTLDCPLRLPQSMPYYPKGGTKLDEIADMANSIVTFALSADEGAAGATYLERRFKIPAVICSIPLGVHNTDVFVKKLAEVTGKHIPEEIKDERGILLDAMADTFHYTMMRRAAICGDPGIAGAATRFVCELGMEPVAVLSGTQSKSFEHEVGAVADEYGINPVVFNGGDMFEWEECIKGEKVDLILGTSKAANICKEVGVPLVRIGFPIYDRVGYQRRANIGYRGSEYLLDLIVNTILDNKFPDDRVHQ